MLTVLFKIELYRLGIDIKKKTSDEFINYIVCIYRHSLKKQKQYYVPEYPKGLKLFKISRMFKWSENK